MGNRILDSYRTWRKYRQTVDELSRLTGRELDDLGISRYDITKIARKTSRP